MKAERLNNMMHLDVSSESQFAVVEKLPGLNSEYSGTVTEESDVDDYYPYVIGHGTNFKVIDPKVYKQLRRHNVQRKKPVQVVERARKTATPKNRTAITNLSTSSSTDVDDTEEYCELSPLAKAPPLPFPSLRLQSLDPKTETNFGKISSFERRLYSNCYYSPTKHSIVESTPSSPTSPPTTKLVDNSRKGNNESPHWTSNKQEALLCGVEADELIDCATCMCCVKGIFYHSTKDSPDEGQLADEPCSCVGPVSSCVPRWGLLAVLSIFIPCLWCYLPAVGCKKAAKSANRKKTERHYKFNAKSSKR